MLPRVPLAELLKASNARMRSEWSSEPLSGELGSSPPLRGLPRRHSGKESACQCRRCWRHSFNLRVRKVAWRRKWQPSPVFWPGESQGQRSMVGCSSSGHKDSDMTVRQSTAQHMATGKPRVCLCSVQDLPPRQEEESGAVGAPAVSTEPRLWAP